MLIITTSMRLINVKEDRRGNQEWTIQRHWQHWAHKAQNEDKKKHTHTQKTKNKSKWALPKKWC